MKSSAAQQGGAPSPVMFGGLYTILSINISTIHRSYWSYKLINQLSDSELGHHLEGMSLIMKPLDLGDKFLAETVETETKEWVKGDAPLQPEWPL